MPSRRYLNEADRPVFLPTRMPRVMIEYLHLIVRLKREGFAFAGMSDLQRHIVEWFIALAPDPTTIAWKTPRAATADDSPMAFRQIQFSVPRSLAEAVDTACDRLGVKRATFLYTATFHYIEHVANPKALQLA